MSRLSSPLPLSPFLAPHSTCSYMRLCPAPALLRFSQRSLTQRSTRHPCYRPLESVSNVIPGYLKSFSCSHTTPSNKMSSSEGIIANLYNASVNTPENLSGSPEDVVNKSHHLKCGKGFTNPWPRYIPARFRSVITWRFHCSVSLPHFTL